MSKTTRREFLSTAAKGSAFLSIGFGLPGPFCNDLLANEQPLSDTGKVLIVLQMSGGNDGLSTVIPLRNDIYYKSRPVLAIKPNKAVKLSDDYGLHPNLAALKPLWDDDQLAIIHGVGYANPDRSHFRSMAIWHTARPDVSEESPGYGWLGKALDSQHLGRKAKLPAAFIGQELPLSLKAATTSVPAIPDPARYGPAAVSKNEKAALGRMMRRPGRGTGNPTLDYLRKASRSAFLSAKELSKMARDYKPAVAYPATGIGQGFKACAQIMAANLGVRIIYLKIGGFDTHAGQQPNLRRLLSWIGEAVAAFMKDQKAHKRDKQVLVMGFSEFGRRVKENLSAGTDHGAAGPMFLASGALKGGFHGSHPRLDKLVQGDLAHTTDFRQVYATVLEDWLGFASRPILGQKFSKLKLF